MTGETGEFEELAQYEECLGCVETTLLPGVAANKAQALAHP